MNASEHSAGAEIILLWKNARILPEMDDGKKKNASSPHSGRIKLFISPVPRVLFVTIEG